jgi:hypothetical protein
LFRAGNPQGDLLKVVTSYQAPLYDNNNPGVIFYEQGLLRDLYTNDLKVLTVEAILYTTQANGRDEVVNADVLGYWETNSYANGVGGVTIDLNDDSFNVFLSTDFHVLDNAGSIYDLEVTFNAPNFSAPIDLMFIPELFDSMDFLDLPSTAWYYCGYC